MNVALIRLSSLGDIILGMAGLQLIRRHRPDCRITWIADAKFADILDHHPDLAQVIKVDLKGLKQDFSFAKMRAELAKLRTGPTLDLAIDLHGMIKSAICARIATHPCHGFRARQIKEPLAALCYARRHDVPQGLNVCYRYAALVAAALGFRFDEDELRNKEPYLFHSHEDLIPTRSYFRSDRRNIILIPGTSTDPKNYPSEKFAMIAQALGGNVLITHGSASERQKAEKIAVRCGCARLLPPLNLNQLKAAIAQADLVIGGDTGPTHIAGANGIPSITLFGATPTCIYETRINRALRADRSIQEIPEAAIIGVAEELLGGAQERAEPYSRHTRSG